MVILLILSIYCNYVKSEGVLIEKYSAEERLDSIPALYGKLCERKDDISECRFTPETRIKWGMGVCENSVAELKKTVKSIRPKIYVNLRAVSDQLISEQDEYYERNEHQYCHTWLIKLSNWKIGETISIFTLDERHFVDGVRIYVGEN